MFTVTKSMLDSFNTPEGVEGFSRTGHLPFPRTGRKPKLSFNTPEGVEGFSRAVSGGETCGWPLSFQYPGGC